MCLAIVSPKNCRIPYSHLVEGYFSNPHGAGFAYAVNGRLVIKKGFFRFRDFWESFKYVNGRCSALVHFRWATHGAHNKLNCHPWRINENHAMIHNGVLSNYTQFNNGLSDTGNFNKEVLQPMFADHIDVWRKSWFIPLLSDAIGGGNKMAIMDSNGDFVIYNEKFGNWQDGVWYSNYDYVKPKPKKKKKSFYSSGELVEAKQEITIRETQLALPAN